ncbi:MAG: hypothetical protein AAFY11_03940 [Cyanobacteria bacterium J06641_5]
MSTKFTRLLSGFLFSSAVAIGTASVAVARPISTLGISKTTDAFEDAFQFESGDYFENRGLLRQIDFIFGLGSSFRLRGSYPENEQDRDAERVHILYTELLNQQLTTQPVIRTRDLVSPYQHSLREGVPGPQSRLPQVRPAPAPAPIPAPVRALW